MVTGNTVSYGSFCYLNLIGSKTLSHGHGDFFVASI